MNVESESKHRDLGGLCSRCRLARTITPNKGSVFILCTLSATDDRFAKYPLLPVLSCPGFQPKQRGPCL